MTAVASFERPIDLVHLARQTLGDRELEREILALFVRQSRTLGSRIAALMTGPECGDLVHTLKGSARAVGAWRVARQAEQVEDAMLRSAKPAGEACDPVLSREIRELTELIAEANDVITSLSPAG